MIVAELVWPGAFVDHADEGEAHELEAVLTVLEGCLLDATFALNAFNDAQHDTQARFDRSRWETKNAERLAIQRELEAELGPPDNDTRFADYYMKLHQLAERELLRRRVAAGQTPDGIANRAPFIYARAFIYAVDGIVKALETIKRGPVPSGATAALASLKAVVPDVVAVRDTAHHAEDRIRGRDRHGNMITSLPIDTPHIKSDGPGMIVIDALCDNRYGCTLADGRYAEMSIDEATLIAARDAVQSALTGIAWRRGPGRVSPNA